MKNLSLVSIIIPIYKVEKYLNECVESIINQTYTNLEIILVDDGSPDNCGSMCDEYALKDNRIVVIHKENGGLSDARNFGLDKAKGEYIAFVDSDDYINDDYIEKLYKAIIDNNTQISQCGIQKVDGEGNLLEKIGYNKDIIKYKSEFMKEIYDVGWQNIVVWNKLYARELFDNIRFPKGKIHEDEFVTYKILYNLDKIAIIEDCLYNYRQNNEGIMLSRFNVKRLDALEALEERLEFFKQNNEEELYNLTQIAYMATLISFYEKIRDNIKDNKHLLFEIKEKFKKEYKKAKGNNKISLKTKIKMKIFYFNPNIWNILSMMKNKIKKNNL